MRVSVCIHACMCAYVSESFCCDCVQSAQAGLVCGHLVLSIKQAEGAPHAVALRSARADNLAM